MSMAGELVLNHVFFELSLLYAGSPSFQLLADTDVEN